jgi:hypothetical protein
MTASFLFHLNARQLTKALQDARGNGTSMISLIMPPKDQVCLSRGRRKTQLQRQPACLYHFARFAAPHRVDMSARALPQVSRVQKMLADEYGTASNIKSRVNRLSVLSAITSAQQRLKLYTKASASSKGLGRTVASVCRSNCTMLIQVVYVCATGRLNEAMQRYGRVDASKKVAHTVLAAHAVLGLCLFVWWAGRTD